MPVGRHRIHSPLRASSPLRATARAASWALGLALLACLASSSVAFAQAADPVAGGSASPATTDGAAATPSPEEKAASEQAAREEAAQRFQRGLGFYGDGDYALALIEFDRAYQLVPDYRVLYNIGQVSIQLARFARARMALEQYLAEGGTAIPEDRAIDVNRDLRMLVDRTAHLEVTSSQAGAEVSIDDRSVGETPLAGALLLDAGEHQIVLKKKGFQTVTRRVVLAGAERLPLTIELLPAEQEQVVVVQKPDPVKEPPPVDKVERRGPDPAVFAWIATGVLAAAATTTGILGLEAKGRHDEATSHPIDPDDEDEILAMASEAQALFLACDILMVGTAAAFGTSLYLTLHKPKATAKSASGSIEVALLPHAVRLRATF